MVSTLRGPDDALPGTTARRRARERALGLLYEAELKGEPPSAVLAALVVPADPYAAGLVAGVGAEAEMIDELVATHLTGWALERLPVVDRQLLRLASYELARRPEIPVAVVIDEALELAREFSTEDSPRYLNGVLSAIAAELRSGEHVPSPAARLAPP